MLRTAFDEQSNPNLGADLKAQSETIQGKLIPRKLTLLIYNSPTWTLYRSFEREWTEIRNVHPEFFHLNLVCFYIQFHFCCISFCIGGAHIFIMRAMSIWQDREVVLSPSYPPSPPFSPQPPPTFPLPPPSSLPEHSSRWHSAAAAHPDILSHQETYNVTSGKIDWCDWCLIS